MLTKLNRTCAWLGEKSLILPVRSRTDVDIQASGPQKVSVEASDSKVSACLLYTSPSPRDRG